MNDIFSMTPDQLDTYLASILENHPSPKRAAEMYESILLDVKWRLFCDDLDGGS